jgi:hypothetical protein
MTDPILSSQRGVTRHAPLTPLQAESLSPLASRRMPAPGDANAASQPASTSSGEANP